ncbi:MAG: aspartate-semialdehyde dehydrogenase, partial [Alphaproteobacteria bacterium]
MSDKRDRRVAVVGATGVAGQQFIAALDRHPWFRVTALAASERSAGRSYREALTDAKTGARRWYCYEESSLEMPSMPVVDVRELDLDACYIVFTSVEINAAPDPYPP